MAQVNIYVSGTERERFSSYAAEFGLDVTALSNLLLVRELRVGLLSTLAPKGRGGDRKSEKITAHMPDNRHEDFLARAKQNGLSMSEAGAMLVLAELEKRWLEKSVDNPGIKCGQ